MVTELEMKYRRLSRNYDELEEKYEAAQEELKNIINRHSGQMIIDDKENYFRIKVLLYNIGK